MVYITLRQARALGACQSGIDGLIARLGREPGLDEPIPLSVVLDTRGLPDTLWCLAHLDRARLVRWAVDCAEAAALVAEPLVAAQIEGGRSRAALDTAAELRTVLRTGASMEEIKRLQDTADDIATDAIGCIAANVVGVVVATAVDAAVSAAVSIDYALADTPSEAAVATASVTHVVVNAAALAAYATGADANNARLNMYRWCRERLRAYLEGVDPGPVSIEEVS